MSFKIIKKSDGGGSLPRNPIRRISDIYRGVPIYGFAMRNGGGVYYMESGGTVDPETDPNQDVTTPVSTPVPAWDGSLPNDVYAPTIDDITAFNNVYSSTDPSQNVLGSVPAWNGALSDDVYTPTVDDITAFNQQQPGRMDASTAYLKPMMPDSMRVNPMKVDVNQVNKSLQNQKQENIRIDQEEFNANQHDANQLANPSYLGLGYGGIDLGSRAAMLGRSIGRAGADMGGGARAANIAQGIFSGVSLATGLAREIAGAASSERARQKDLAGYRNKMATERRNSFIQYTAGGGEVNTGNGTKFNTGDLTGEYLYPLPKSMEDNANVEVEKGEYVLRPDVTGPMEAKGHPHETGGTLVDLPDGTLVVSDHRKITPDLVIRLADEYGLKSSVKDTYAKVLDRYKKKIGLKDAYDEQERVYKRLQKNESIKDKNTSDFNKSVLSKYVADNQKKIDELEPRFRDFANMVYESQEAVKRVERINDFFRDGGPVSLENVLKMAKKAKIEPERAKELVYEQYRANKRKRFENGGEPTEEEMELGRLMGQDFLNTFGRQLTFAPVYVQGTESFLNPNTGVMENQGYQVTGKESTYGNAGRDTAANLVDVNRYGRRYLTGDNWDVEGFQEAYNDQMNAAYALGASGAITNADAMKDFRLQGFWGQTSTNIGDPNTTQNSFAVDNKYGQTTASRPFYSLDVVTPEQRRLLNEKGIKNFVDLFENEDEAKKILGSDFDRFKKLKDTGRFNNIDFVLGEYTPRKTADPLDPGPVEGVEAPGKPGIPAAPSQRTTTEQPKEDTGFRGYVGRTSPAQRERGNNAPWYNGLMFPEILREYPGGIITPGLERHQAPHVDPVTRSADQYINELNRATTAQLNALGDVPDSQRAAILANMNAIADSNIARYVNDTEAVNAERRAAARQYNTEGYVNTDDKNIAERQRYEQGVLQAMAIDDENRARFWDSINNEIQQKWNVATSMNTIRALAPDMAYLPNGQIVYNPRNGEPVGRGGDYSSPLLYALAQQYADEEAKRRGGSR